MKKNPRTPKARSPRRSATPTPIPPQLAGLLALVLEHVGTDHAADMARALDEARASLRQPLDDDNPLFDRIHRFITEEAQRGPWKDLDAYIDQIDEHAHGFTPGDYRNVYAIPAVLIGLALGYAYCLEGAK